MKKRFLLFSLLLIAMNFTSKAEDVVDTINYLIFTEVRMDHIFNNYAELTNMGDAPVDLSKFKVVALSQFHTGWNGAGNERKIILPNRMLQPGESITIGRVYDLIDQRAKEQPWEFESFTKPDMWELMDIPVHVNETGHAGDYIYAPGDDSLSVYYDGLFGGNGICAWFIQYNNGVDSFPVDAVNVVIDASTNKPVTKARDVAGVINGTDNHTLVRKYNIKHGNIDWDNSRGVDISDSEWLPIPNVLKTDVQSSRISFWTIGNHGDYTLDENTLEPLNPEIEVDFANGIINVPWGIRNDDYIMTQFKKKPGIAWNYDYAPSHNDSAYSSARTGDSLTIFVAGSDLYVKGFKIVVKDQKSSDNMVVPMYNDRDDGTYKGLVSTQFKVTYDNPVMDTIWDINYGTRVDTLLKFLEKPELATWQIEFLNNEVRSDVMTGDLLSVTANNGDVKKYFIKVWPYFGSSNTLLSAITWPDIPEWYNGILGWKGDTIPNFAPATTNYALIVPFDVEGIPALVAQTQDINASFEMIRAKNINGTIEERTITINVTSAGGDHKRSYSILLKKEKNPADLQPWKADPFISQYSHREQQADWGSAWEFMNPGTEEIDMRDYMFAKGQGTPADVIMGNNDIGNRMNKYIFGLKWADTATWNVTPGIFVPDNNVNPIVTGGDVFVLSSLGWWSNYTKPNVNSWGIDVPVNKHWNYAELDVNFRDLDNPWHIPKNTQNGNCVDDAGTTNTFWLFKILSDSVKRGLKPATDPNDFEVVDVWGHGNGTKNVYVNFNGKNNIVHKTVHFRKPNIYKGNPVPGASFGTTQDDAEWYSYAATADLVALGFRWPWQNLMVSGWLGSHDMIDASIYKSTVSSTVYIVSEGFSMNETIKGVVDGTTVQDFYTKILKSDTAQTLTVSSNGVELELDDILTNNAELTVVSADKTNSSKYILNVTANGLSSDAVLSSSKSDYVIEIKDTTATIKGFGYELSIADLLSDLIVPPGASLNVIDDEDKYVSLQTFNYDSIYVAALVSNQIYFEVIAENGVTKIIYQLLPASATDEVFVTSQMYVIDQLNSIINRIPEATNVETFYKYLVPSADANMVVVDKYNFQRVAGTLHYDDKLIVTSADGMIKRIYYMTMVGVDPAFLYLKSDVYTIDQWAFSIKGAAVEFPTVSNFIGNLTASEGASIKVFDVEGNERSNNEKLNAGDELKLISGNGKYQMTYSIDLGVSVFDVRNSALLVYPNPSKGIIHINGIESGNSISVYNIAGILLSQKISQGTSEIIDMSQSKTGLYFIRVDTRVSSYIHKILINR